LKIDNQIYLETAEGIDIQLTPAGLGVRTLAFFYDFLIRAAIYVCAAIVLQFAGQFGMGLLFIITFTIEWFYPVVFEITQGATPGKKSYGLVVVYDNGLPVSFSGSLTRNLFRAVDFLPAFYTLGGICMLLSGKSKRVGDYLAGTMVVFKERPIRLGNFSADKAQTIDIALDSEQQKAIIEFAERSKTLSNQRQQELANILAPIVDCEGELAVQKIKAIAANLVGKS